MRVSITLTMWVVGMALIIRANFLSLQMLDEVNAQSPPSERVSRFFLQSKFGAVQSRHKQLFPTSSKRRRATVVWILGMSLLIGGFILLLV